MHQLWMLCKDIRLAESPREGVKDIADRQPRPANDRLALTNLRVHDDPVGLHPRRIHLDQALPNGIRMTSFAQFLLRSGPRSRAYAFRTAIPEIRRKSRTDDLSESVFHRSETRPPLLRTRTPRDEELREIRSARRAVAVEIRTRGAP